MKVNSRFPISLLPLKTNTDQIIIFEQNIEF